MATKANAKDQPRFHEAMQGQDSDAWYEAMKIEYEGLENMDAWEEVPREQAQGQILDSTWALRRKRYPDGSVRKLKARLCVRGDQQVYEQDFFNTYAPVVQWTTVRVLLILTVALGLATKQVDYTSAFCQSFIKEDVYIEMPKLFNKPGKVLKLKRCVYGLKQAPLTFYEHLSNGLMSRGWKRSKIDPCLFYKNGLVCLCYVDDCLFFATNETLISNKIELLREKGDNEYGFQLEIEDDVAGFLGILIDKSNKEGYIELKQEGLIKRILSATNLEECNPAWTPAEKTPLGKCEDDGPCSEVWNYASVLGMMMYLATNSRPDIAYAVNQCARFTNAPKRKHEVAIKRIARYLKGTLDRGMVIKPKKDLRLDLYADADFAGLWNVEKHDDPVSVKSRTGWLLTLGDIPITWASKLQTEIALSTFEAEYIALSTGLRQLLAARELMQEISKEVGIARKTVSMISKAFEDNNAALKHANDPLPKLTPRSKHLGVKYHWFKSKIKGEIEVHPIDTKLQRADIFTKGLTCTTYEGLRKWLMGW